MLHSNSPKTPCRQENEIWSPRNAWRHCTFRPLGASPNPPLLFPLLSSHLCLLSVLSLCSLLCQRHWNFPPSPWNVLPSGPHVAPSFISLRPLLWWDIFREALANALWLKAPPCSCPPLSSLPVSLYPIIQFCSTSSLYFIAHINILNIIYFVLLIICLSPPEYKLHKNKDFFSSAAIFPALRICQDRC